MGDNMFVYLAVLFLKKGTEDKGAVLVDKE